MVNKARKFFDEVGKGVVTAGKDIGKSAVKTFSSKAGQMVGQAALDALPLLAFKSGGKIPGPRGKARKIIAHSGETILPLNAPPTKRQLAIIKKNKQVSLMKSGKLS